MKNLFGALLGFLLWAPSAAALTVSGNGLTDLAANYACDAGPCLSNIVLSLDALALATGTIDIDGGALTANINITLSSFTFVGNVGGTVDEVVFSNVIYSALVNILIVGDQITQNGAAVGTVSGTYEQLFNGGVVVADQAFAAAPNFLNLDCLIPGGVGQCGLRVGLGVPVVPNFSLNVDGDVLEVVNVFNVTVVPEPSAGALLAGGLLLTSAVTRRARSARQN